jgi:peptidoglycan/xylan/chitin deacetylase (PgdA/CDA1 family)
MIYFCKTPGWLKKIYASCTWQIKTDKKIIYLSFDDGPHPEATPFVLDELKKYNARATFFCIGKNVAAHPDIYTRIIDEGHTTGNHTFNHLNGWKTKMDLYLENIAAAQQLISTDLFRPPYGKITFSQMRLLLNRQQPFKIIMWTVLSGDFDPGISNLQCLHNVISNTGKGSIVVFHDSEKALNKMQFTLPKILAHFTEQGYQFEKIS